MNKKITITLLTTIIVLTSVATRVLANAYFSYYIHFELPSITIVLDKEEVMRKDGPEEEVIEDEADQAILVD